MPARPQSPLPEGTPKSGVDDFARSVHASYLSRWLRHDPAALEKTSQQAATERKRRRRNTSAA